MRARSRALLVAGGAALAAPAPAAAALTAAVEREAKLERDGAVRATVRIACDASDQVLEAHLGLSQDAGAVSGTGGIGGIVCDGRTRRYRVRVRAFDGAFHRGPASASAFVLVLQPDGSTESVSPTGTVRI